MKTTKTLLAALCVMLLWACTASGGQKAETVQNQADLSFLTSLGIDMNKVTTIGTDFNGGSDAEAQSLTHAQGRALLGQVIPYLSGETPDEQADVPGNFFITGVKPMAGGYTLVMFLIEFGDGSSESVGIYDSKGTLTDFADLGSWLDFGMEEAEQDMRSGTGYKTEAGMNSITDKGFTIDRSLKYVNWKLEKSTVGEDDEPYPVPTPTGTIWELKKQYVYTLDTNGHLRLAMPLKTRTTGTPDRVSLLRDEIDDLDFLPISDASRFDRLNSLAEKVNVMTQEIDDQLQYNIEVMAWRYFDATPQAFLRWIADHRDNPGHILKIFENIFSKAYVPKERLVEQISAMPAGEARDYLERLTAQWGPADAVG